MAAEVEFFYDFASPYTYLASTQMKGLAERTGAKIQWRPFVLGGVFQATENRAPFTVKAKALHMSADLERWGRLYGVPISMPTIFPMKTITALRMALAADREGAIVPFSDGKLTPSFDSSHSCLKSSFFVFLQSAMKPVQNFKII